MSKLVICIPATYLEALPHGTVVRMKDSIRSFATDHLERNGNAVDEIEIDETTPNHMFKDYKPGFAVNITGMEGPKSGRMMLAAGIADIVIKTVHVEYR